MSSVNDLKFAAITNAGFDQGSLGDREYQWLAYQTSIESGITLNDQWMTLLTLLGYTSGNINERQMQAWTDLGYGFENVLLETGDDVLLEDGGHVLLQDAATSWPDMAKLFWADGGEFTPAFVLLETGDNVLLETGDFLLMD